MEAWSPAFFSTEPFETLELAKRLHSGGHCHKSETEVHTKEEGHLSTSSFNSRSLICASGPCEKSSSYLDHLCSSFNYICWFTVGGRTVGKKLEVGGTELSDAQPRFFFSQDDITNCIQHWENKNYLCRFFLDAVRFQGLGAIPLAKRSSTGWLSSVWTSCNSRASRSDALY